MTEQELNELPLGDLRAQEMCRLLSQLSVVLVNHQGELFNRGNVYRMVAPIVKQALLRGLSANGE